MNDLETREKEFFESNVEGYWEPAFFYPSDLLFPRNDLYPRQREE